MILTKVFKDSFQSRLNVFYTIQVKYIKNIFKTFGKMVGWASPTLPPWYLVKQDFVLILFLTYRFMYLEEISVNLNEFDKWI